MKHTRHLGRWIAAGVGALVLSGAGVAGATTPPTEPSADTSMGTAAETGDTSTGATSEAMTGAGPSDCPPIAAAAESTAPAASEVAIDTAPADATATTGGETMATTATSAAETMETTAASVAATSGPFVQVAESDEYGQILVDAECRTLYVFSPDVDGEPTCVDDCAGNWPPLLVPEESVPPLADELDPSLFSVVEHPEGAMLKVGNWPLYHFANDAAPGDVNGQGVGGVWWVVGPDGTPFEEATEGTEPTDGSAAPAGSAPAASMPTETAPMTTSG